MSISILSSLEHGEGGSRAPGPFPSFESLHGYGCGGGARVNVPYPCGAPMPVSSPRWVDQTRKTTVKGWWRGEEAPGLHVAHLEWTSGGFGYTLRGKLPLGWAPLARGQSQGLGCD